MTWSCCHLGDLELLSVTASCVSIPTDSDPSPLLHDFAVLKLARTPKTSTPLSLAASDSVIALGADVAFSGYPLLTPGMVTHRGMISGWNEKKEVIFIQGAINKGNSGGALISADGKVVGIVSMREGGIGKGLLELIQHIDATSKQGNVLIMGVDPLQATKATLQALDTYISTGIGYAHSVQFVREWLSRSGIMAR